MTESSTPSPKTARTGILVLSALVLANPAVTFALFGNVVLSLGGLIATASVFLEANRRWGTGLPTIYLVNAVALLSLLAHAELIFRFRFADYAIPDLYARKAGYYFNKPLMRQRLTDKEYAVDYLTNRDGFRIGHSQDTELSFRTVDWLVIGDSFTQGAQVQFEELYTTHLYRAFPDKIVANAGISGFGLPQEYEYLVQEGLKYQPSMVFLQLSAFNDFMKVAPSHFTVSDFLVERSDFIRFLLQDLKYKNPASLPLGRWVEPFYPEEEDNRRYNIFYRLSSPDKERDIREFRIHLTRVHEVLSKRGIRLVVVFIPTKEQVDYRYLREVVEAFEIDPQLLDMELPNRILRAIADSIGFDLIDLQQPFEATSEPVYYRYDEHLSPHGHRVMADAIRAFLVSKGYSSESRLLSRDFHGDRYPSATADGRLILYQSPTDGNSELYIADSTFAERRRLTVDDVDQSHPTISRAGNHLVYTEGDASIGLTNVVMSALDGTNRRVLTEGAGVCGAIPDISPDGMFAAYAEWQCDIRSGQTSVAQIVLLDLASGDKATLSPSGTESWRPVFAPDGRSVAYIRRVNGQYDLFVVDLHSRQESRKTATPFDEWDPRFSLDGRSIAYAAKADGNWDLFLLDLSSGMTRQLTKSAGDEWDPSFVPGNGGILYGGEYGIFRGVYSLTLR